MKKNSAGGHKTGGEHIMADITSEVTDVLKQLQQAVAQLVQISQGVTVGQMSGQRVDRTDTAASAIKQDIGSDELKDAITGMQSARTLDVGSMVSSGGMSYRAAIEAVNLQIIQNGATLGHLIGSKAAENVLGVNVTDFAEASAVKALESKGYKVTR